MRKHAAKTVLRDLETFEATARTYMWYTGLVLFEYDRNLLDVLLLLNLLVEDKV